VTKIRSKGTTRDALILVSVHVDLDKCFNFEPKVRARFYLGEHHWGERLFSWFHMIVPFHCFPNHWLHVKKGYDIIISLRL
jgi:hypothetical protein